MTSSTDVFHASLLVAPLQSASGDVAFTTIHSTASGAANTRFKLSVAPPQQHSNPLDYPHLVAECYAMHRTAITQHRSQLPVPLLSAAASRHALARLRDGRKHTHGTQLGYHSVGAQPQRQWSLEESLQRAIAMADPRLRATHSGTVVGRAGAAPARVALSTITTAKASTRPQKQLPARTQPPSPIGASVAFQSTPAPPDQQMPSREDAERDDGEEEEDSIHAGGENKRMSRPPMPAAATSRRSWQYRQGRSDSAPRDDVQPDLPQYYYDSSAEAQRHQQLPQEDAGNEARNSADGREGVRSASQVRFSHFIGTNPLRREEAPQRDSTTATLSDGRPTDNGNVHNHRSASPAVWQPSSTGRDFVPEQRRQPRSDEARSSNNSHATTRDGSSSWQGLRPTINERPTQRAASEAGAGIPSPEEPSPEACSHENGTTTPEAEASVGSQERWYAIPPPMSHQRTPPPFMRHADGSAPLPGDDDIAPAHGMRSVIHTRQPTQSFLCSSPDGATPLACNSNSPGSTGLALPSPITVCSGSLTRYSQSPVSPRSSLTRQYSTAARFAHQHSDGQADDGDEDCDADSQMWAQTGFIQEDDDVHVVGSDLDEGEEGDIVGIDEDGSIIYSQTSSSQQRLGGEGAVHSDSGCSGGYCPMSDDLLPRRASTGDMIVTASGHPHPAAAAVGVVHQGGTRVTRLEIPAPVMSCRLVLEQQTGEGSVQEEEGSGVRIGAGSTHQTGGAHCASPSMSPMCSHYTASGARSAVAAPGSIADDQPGRMSGSIVSVYPQHPYASPGANEAQGEALEDVAESEGVRYSSERCRSTASLQYYTTAAAGRGSAHYSHQRPSWAPVKHSRFSCRSFMRGDDAEGSAARHSQSLSLHHVSRRLNTRRGSSSSASASAWRRSDTIRSSTSSHTPRGRAGVVLAFSEEDEHEDGEDGDANAFPSSIHAVLRGVDGDINDLVSASVAPDRISTAAEYLVFRQHAVGDGEDAAEEDGEMFFWRYLHSLTNTATTTTTTNTLYPTAQQQHSAWRSPTVNAVLNHSNTFVRGASVHSAGSYVIARHFRSSVATTTTTTSGRHHSSPSLEKDPSTEHTTDNQTTGVRSPRVWRSLSSDRCGGVGGGSLARSHMRQEDDPEGTDTAAVDATPMPRRPCVLDAACWYAEGGVPERGLTGSYGPHPYCCEEEEEEEIDEATKEFTATKGSDASPRSSSKSSRLMPPCTDPQRSAHAAIATTHHPECRGEDVENDAAVAVGDGGLLAMTMASSGSPSPKHNGRLSNTTINNHHATAHSTSSTREGRASRGLGGVGTAGGVSSGLEALNSKRT